MTFSNFLKGPILDLWNRAKRKLTFQYTGVFFYDPFFTSPCGHNFEDIGLRFFFGQIVEEECKFFFYMQHVVIYSIFFHEN